MAKIVDGDVLDEDLAERIPSADAVIHLVGIIREAPRKGVTYERLHVDATKNVVNAATSRGIRRFIHMSALGADPEGPTGYFRSKGRAEQIVRASELDWTIFRPSVVFGPGDDFVNMLGGQVRAFPVVPVIGDGAYTLQPVSVGDVVSGFVDALEQPETISQTFCVSGPETMSYDDLLDSIARGLGKKRARKAHFPLGLMRPTIRAMEGLSFFPITTDQLTMLLESNVCDPTPYFDTFRISPTHFEQGIKEYLPQSA
jgi:NADH dehydrogenase